MNYKVIYSNELYHHGIKGQRWGVRRFQNEDGSLTSAGKVRRSESYSESKSNNQSGETPDSRRQRLKKAAVIGASVVAVGLAAYGGYKLNKVIKDRNILKKDKSYEYVSELLKERSKNSLNSIPSIDEIDREFKYWDDNRVAEAWNKTRDTSRAAKNAYASETLFKDNTAKYIRRRSDNNKISDAARETREKLKERSTRKLAEHVNAMSDYNDSKEHRIRARKEYKQAVRDSFDSIRKSDNYRKQSEYNAIKSSRVRSNMSQQNGISKLSKNESDNLSFLIDSVDRRSKKNRR